MTKEIKENKGGREDGEIYRNMEGKKQIMEI
jgi:hypothetical protein